MGNCFAKSEQKNVQQQQVNKLKQEENWVDGKKHGKQVYYDVGIFEHDNKVIKVKKLIQYYENGQQIGDSVIIKS